MKLNFTQSTIIMPTDSSLGSIGQSRFTTFRDNSLSKRLSNSLEIISTPYNQTLPLKFPKNRIRKQCHQHILSESPDPNYKTCIRTSQLRNRQYVHQKARPFRSPGTFHKHSRQSQGNFIRDTTHVIHNHTKSLQAAHSKSKSPTKVIPIHEKKQRKHFQYRAVIQNIKDPILIGQSPKKLMNTNYEQIATDSRIKRYYGEGFKNNLQWKVNSSKEKDQFKQKHSNAIEQNSSKYEKGKLSYNPNQTSLQLGSIGQSKISQGSSNQNKKTKTYKQLHNSRKRVIQ